MLTKGHSCPSPQTAPQIEKVMEVQALKGKGLAGDRKFRENNLKHCQITLIEIENISYFNKISKTSKLPPCVISIVNLDLALFPPLQPARPGLHVKYIGAAASAGFVLKNCRLLHQLFRCWEKL